MYLPARRQFLKTFLGASASLLAAPNWTAAKALAAGRSTLRAKAAAKGIRFGSEVTFDELHDPDYAALVSAQCSIVTPGLEAKWYATEPAEGQFDFTRLDWMMGFAKKHALAVHLHNLVWGVYEPPWVEPAVRIGRAEEILHRHILSVAQRYKGRADSWDVLNEPSDPRWSHGPEGLTYTMWRTALGPLYPAMAFGWARQADPSAKLFVNDDGLEYDTPVAAAKRETYLRLIDGWLASGVPISGFGLESHIQPDRPFDAGKYRKFLGALAARGLIVYITEMDVTDKTLPADFAERDRLIAEACARVLDAALDEKAVKCVMTWGLSTRTSWLSNDSDTKRDDGLPTRGLPFDDDLQPTAMFEAIVRAFDSAPVR